MTLRLSHTQNRNALSLFNINSPIITIIKRGLRELEGSNGGGLYKLMCGQRFGGIERFSFFLGFPSIFLHFQIENFKYSIIETIALNSIEFNFSNIGYYKQFGLKVPY